MRSLRERCLEGTVFIQNTGWGLSPHSRSNHEAHIVKKCCPIAIDIYWVEEMRFRNP